MATSVHMRMRRPLVGWVDEHETEKTPIRNYKLFKELTSEWLDLSMQLIQAEEGKGEKKKAQKARELGTLKLFKWKVLCLLRYYFCLTQSKKHPIVTQFGKSPAQEENFKRKKEREL